jgi:hypothetical protein
MPGGTLKPLQKHVFPAFQGGILTKFVANIFAFLRETNNS